MNEFFRYVLLLLGQFAGGPGPRENNLVRFGLPAVLWGVLLIIAWTRQRQDELPRENLLVWGFGLGLARELFMFSHVSMQLLGVAEGEILSLVTEPLEHGLTMAAIVVVSGAFLRYILDDVRLPRVYLRTGLVAAGLCCLATFWWWARQSAVGSRVRFNQSEVGLFIHISTTILIVIAITILAKKRGWLRNVVSLALVFLFIDEFVRIFNYFTAKAYADIVCPLGNSFHIWAIPVLGYVYLREQAMEKQQTEEALEAYRDHLEELVKDRTSELTAANEQLQWQIGERRRAEEEIARLYQETERWAKDLTLLHQVSIFLNSTLDPSTIYRVTGEQSAKLLDCQVAHIFRWEEGNQRAVGVSSYGVDGSGVRGMGAYLEEGGFLSDLVVHRQAVLISDGRMDERIPLAWRETFDIQALLGVPVWGRERPLGFLLLIDQNGPREWRANEVQLVESIVNRAAGALENAYLHQQVEWAATLEERQRIAAEMHDGLAQTLSYMGHRIDRLAELVESNQVNELLDECHHVRDTIDQASREVRRSIASLQENPPPRRPLQEILTQMVEEFDAKGGASVNLVTGLEQPLFLSPDQVEQVTRVVQEAISNADRHAKANEITVYLEQKEDCGSIIVMDNGRGFDPDLPSTDGNEHFGLSIMHARAVRIGGQVNVESTPGQGTWVQFKWPLNGLDVDA